MESVRGDPLERVYPYKPRPNSDAELTQFVDLERQKNPYLRKDLRKF